MSRERRRIVAVGLTGGIGAGKSTALALFAELGALTLSADGLVHDLYSRSKVSGRVAAHFGPDVLDANGAIDRSRLAEMVRGQREELAWLEGLVHPLVARDIRGRLREAPGGTVVICEVPLLFEAGHEALFDLIVTVEAGADSRRRRSTHRFDLDQFSELEAMQASSETRVQRSDMAFFNDGDLDGLRGFVREVYDRATELLKEGR
ncbi:MAG: dephospho-CoA kinase [Actinobacteria bacterium RBG_16_64_13]|nr:MAG: dephospho-CoA kinase [Actinobacteria bacterium RBG_16_64_13]